MWFLSLAPRKSFLSDIGGLVPNYLSYRNKTRTLENIAANEVNLTPEDIKAIDQVLIDNPVKGGRYNPQMEATLMR